MKFCVHFTSEEDNHIKIQQEIVETDDIEFALVQLRSLKRTIVSYCPTKK